MKENKMKSNKLRKIGGFNKRRKDKNLMFGNLKIEIGGKIVWLNMDKRKR